MRWLLGLGDNVEVVAPAGLRRVIGEQAHKMARHYARLSVVGADEEDEQRAVEEDEQRAVEGQSLVVG